MNLASLFFFKVNISGKLELVRLYYHENYEFRSFNKEIKGKIMCKF